MSRLLSALLLLPLFIPLASAEPSAKKPAPPAAKAEEVTIPSGSADYSKMLAAVMRYKRGEIPFEQLKKIVIAAKLPPHRLKCGYLIMPVPAPPPGVPFDPASMPPDWAHTFGEVTMTFWAGKLTREEYDRLHEAAHHDLPGFPSCSAAAN